MTADAAVRGIRSVDDEGSVGLVCEEEVPPYDRPPLSKGLWSGMEEERIWRRTDDLDVDLHLDRRVLRIDPDDHAVRDDRGTVYTYEKLLLATGGRPRELEDAVPQVNYFRTLDDYRRLREQAESGRTFVVVGGGFIGSEIAAALAGRDKQVTLVFPEEHLAAKIFPPSVGERLNRIFRDGGVDLRPGVGVASVRRSGDRLLVATREEDPSDTLRVDGVVAGLGIRPNDELAGTAGLDVVDPEEGGGIEVDPHLRTSAPDVYAAGDVASVWFGIFGRRLRVEHEDQANTTGAHAGRAMAGEATEYQHLPYCYSEAFGVGWEGVGLLDPSLEVVEVGEGDLTEPAVLYYMDRGRVRGVALFNHPGQLRTARELIESREPLEPDHVHEAIPLP
jgi:NADPH-dependent 2,4-dienoyl-CoA reductase/sulfur reductase-like enzyme